MRSSLHRASSLDSVDGCIPNPKVGGSNPPPAINFTNKLRETRSCIDSHSAPVQQWPPCAAIVVFRPVGSTMRTTLLLASRIA
jgi:hypothetical protein